jgi:DNA mismatch repair protein PMS2
VLQGYALISVGVRLTVTNTAGGKGPSRLIATQSNARLEDNVSNIFGAKTLAGLQPLTVDIAEEEGDDTATTAATATAATASTDAVNVVAEEIAAVAQTAQSRRRIIGLVSKAGEGVGRSDNDRQFTFLNGRPVDLPKVGRVLNEVSTAHCYMTPFVMASELLCNGVIGTMMITEFDGYSAVTAVLPAVGSILVISYC